MDRAREDLLVLNAQAGDQQALGLLYRSYNAALQRFAFRVSGDEQLALDAVQEAWITLSRSMRKLQDPRGFKVWAYKTVRWRVNDLLRQKKGIHVPLDEHTTLIAEEPAYATSDQLRRHINALPEKDRAALVLFYLDGLQVQEIAAIEESPVGTIKSRLSRAREKLRDTMTGDEE